MSARNFACALSIAVALGLPGVAAADYPEHSIRFEVGQAPGGSTDVVARLVARQIGEILGEPVIVENRTGNSGSIAADFVAKSKPDGYTMLVVSSSYSINPSLSNLPFDPKKDLAPVSLLAEAPFLLVVRPDFSAHNVDELLKLADAKHGALTYGSGGNGSSGHLAGALLSQLSRHEFTHVPYKGGAAMLAAVAGGEVQISFTSLAGSLPLAASLIALAVTAAMATVPTGFSGLPPSGPAMPVTPTPTSTPARDRRPSAMASATGSLTAPCVAINSAGTPSSSVLASLL